MHCCAILATMLRQMADWPGLELMNKDRENAFGTGLVIENCANSKKSGKLFHVHAKFKVERHDLGQALFYQHLNRSTSRTGRKILWNGDAGRKPSDVNIYTARPNPRVEGIFGTVSCHLRLKTGTTADG